MTKIRKYKVDEILKQNLSNQKRQEFRTTYKRQTKKKTLFFYLQFFCKKTKNKKNENQTQSYLL